MEIKFVSSPIGVFESTYSNSGLLRLSFLWGRESRYPHDRPLQKKIDKFYKLKVITYDISGQGSLPGRRMLLIY